MSFDLGKTMLKRIALLACTLASPTFATEFSNWKFVSHNMLTADGESEFADRLEIVALDSCIAFELRVWARAFDKESNFLEAGDVMDAALSVGEIPMLKKSAVITVVSDFSDDFDIVYLSFGTWDWSAKDLFVGLKDDFISATFSDAAVGLEANDWHVENLGQNLSQLQSACAMPSIPVQPV